MHFLHVVPRSCCIQPFNGHAYVSHRGELDHQQGSGVKELLLEVQYVRRTILEQEYFPSSSVPSCRIQENYVRAETAEDFVYRGGGDFMVAYGDVVDAQLPEIMFRSLREQSVHLVIEDASSLCGECPVVDSEASCQVGQPESGTALHQPGQQHGLIACRDRG